MIWQLMMLDSSWVWAPILMLVGIIMCGLGGGFPFTGLLFIAGCIAASRDADTLLHSALPVTVRQILIARMLSALALVWLPLSVCAPLLVMMPGSGMDLRMVLALGSALTLVLVWMQTSRLRGGHVPAWLAFVPVLGWVVQAFAPGLISGPSAWTDWLIRKVAVPTLPVIVFCWLCAAALFWWAWRTIPVGIQVADDKGRAQVRGSAGTPGTAIAILSIIWFLIAAIAGMRHFAEEQWFFLWFAFGLYDWKSMRARLQWLLLLPVSRHAMLATLLLPALLAATAGYSTGAQLSSVTHVPWFDDAPRQGIILGTSQFLPEWRSTVHPPSDCNRLNVLPPAEFWDRAPAGHAPIIESPWGETFQPGTHFLHGFEVFNPYSLGCTNSERFLDWQFDRAAKVVYGRPVARKMTPGKVEALPSAPPLRIQIITIAVLLSCLMVMILVSFGNDWQWVHRRSRFFKWTLGFLGLFSAIMLFSHMNDLAQWASLALPANLPAALTILLMPLALIYWANDAMFRNLEFVDKPAMEGSA